MFNRKLKKEVEFWKQRYNARANACFEYSRQLNRLSIAYNNLRDIVFDDCFHQPIALYSLEGYDFMVYMSHFIYNKERTEFHLTSTSLNTALGSDKIATADIEIVKNKLEIVNLDSHQPRKGHGSRLLGYIDEYSIKSNIVNIWGMLDDNTPIGLENLKRFYQNNGYIITKKGQSHYFKKELIEELLMSAIPAHRHFTTPVCVHHGRGWCFTAQYLICIERTHHP